MEMTIIEVTIFITFMQRSSNTAMKYVKEY